MSAKYPANQPDEDETALSSPGSSAARDESEATEAGPTDATVIRGTPSSPTINDRGGPSESFGKYELLGEIARGGMGVVYKAKQQGLDRLVALKMILGTGITHETAQRFLQEARAAAALDHPNVVPIYDIGENGKLPYFTMALIDGPNLRGFVDAQGTVPIAAAVSLFAQIVAGVAHAHRHGIVHRDLKPANVLIDKDGRPRVTDFGLAKRATTDSQLTVTGQVVGTPQYMAPEQARDSKDVGPPADVYSLGAILYFLLTGKPPFLGESFTDLLLKVVTDPPVPPRQLRADVPADLESLCLRCLAKSPAERFADADALASALAPIADQYLVPSASLAPSLARVGSRPSTPSTPGLPAGPASRSGAELASGPAKPNRKPLLIGLGVAAVLLLGVIAYAATRGDGKKDDGAKQEPPPATAPATPEGGAKEPAKIEWPAISRADFKLTVDTLVDGKKDAEGALQLSAGEPMTLRLKADRNCHVLVLQIDPSGEATCLFPNEHEQDDFLVAGKERVIPGNEQYKFNPTPTAGAGVDRLRIIATTGKPPLRPNGTKVGPFAVYSGLDREQLVSVVRGMVIKKKDDGGAPAVAEKEIPYRVK